MIIHSTQKLLKELNIQPIDIEEKDIFSWHANLVTLNNQKSIVLINDKSRFAITIYGIKSMHKNIIDEIIQNAIDQELTHIGIKDYMISRSAHITFRKLPHLRVTS